MTPDDAEQIAQLRDDVTALRAELARRRIPWTAITAALTAAGSAILHLF